MFQQHNLTIIKKVYKKLSLNFFFNFLLIYYLYLSDYLYYQLLKNMYRLIPLRTLRRTAGVLFDEVVPSDIPKIDGIDRVIHKANGISPGPCEGVKRPWYMHPGQDDNLIVLQGERFIDIYC